EGRAVYRAAVAAILDAAWDPARLRSRAWRAFERMRVAAQPAARPQQPYAATVERVQRILGFFEDRRRSARWQLAAQDDPGLKSRLAGSSQGGGGLDRERG